MASSFSLSEGVTCNVDTGWRVVGPARTPGVCVPEARADALPRSARRNLTFRAAVSSCRGAARRARTFSSFCRDWRMGSLNVVCWKGQILQGTGGERGRTSSTVPVPIRLSNKSNLLSKSAVSIP